MPPWGRPSGGRKGKRPKDREKQKREWEEYRRFEELDSESDDSQGVHLGPTSQADKLRFTGGNLSRRSSDLREFEYTDESEDIDDAEDEYEDSGASMQLALRDKEEVLVQRALERIRRAQQMGQTNVKLTPPERDALERKLRNDRSKEKLKKPAPKSRTSSEVRRPKTRPASSQNSFSSATSRRKSRSSLTLKASPKDLSQPQPGRTSPPPPPPPGFLVADSSGKSIYHPIGYYTPPTNPSPYGQTSTSGPSSRSGSSQSLQNQPTPPLPSTAFRPQKRYYSVPEQYYTSAASASNNSAATSRPMLDDSDWQPRARSASNLPYPLEPQQHQYQAYAGHQQAPPGYGSQGRYPSSRGQRQPGGIPSQRSNGERERSSTYEKRDRSSTSDEGYDDEDDDEDHGVLVDVVPRGGGGYEYEVNVGGQGRRRVGRR